MVDWVGKFDLLLRRVKDSWMDMLPFLIQDGTAKRESVPGRHSSLK